MQLTKYVLIPVVLILVVIAGAIAVMPASAQGSSGQFNPQTQFAVGAKLQITSIYGLETIPPRPLLRTVHGSTQETTPVQGSTTQATIKPHETAQQINSGTSPTCGTFQPQAPP
jgi:hypothetical protein